MLSAGALAVLDVFESAGGPHPARALAERAESQGFEVHGPGDQEEDRCLRLTRTAADGTAVNLYLNYADLSVAAAGLRDVASRLPAAEVTPRDVRFSYAGGDAAAVLSLFSTWPGRIDASWPSPAVTVQMPAQDPAARRRASPWLAVVAGLGLLLVVVGAAAGGIGGALVMAGLVTAGLGLSAVVAGSARWALLASRPAGAVVAAAGLAALIVGGVTVDAAPASSSTAAAAAPTSSASSSPTVDTDAAIASAEASMDDADSGEATSSADVDGTGRLPGDAAGHDVGAAPRTAALAAVGALEVKGRAPKTGYTRAQFGPGWVDTDHNGCDTRNDVLARDLTGETFKPGTHDCVVLTGTLADPYSGTTIAFQRGQGTSEAVQIDHVVALSDAWQTGAQLWDAAKRAAFANDRLDLLAVDGPLNEQKGDGDTATWLPPNKAYRCAYVARQVAVKVSYGLWVTPAERNAMATVLSACPDEPLPGGVVANVPQAAPTSTVAPAPASGPAPAPTPALTPAPGAYYANCTEARAAGAAPLYAGQPGYRSGLDRDHDGVACEG